MKEQEIENLLIECQKQIDCSFSDLKLLRKALTHSSIAQSHQDSNERLEFLGDSVLGLAISDILYNEFPNQNEGIMSQIKSVVVSRKVCRQIAIKQNLQRFLLHGKGLENIPDSLIANLMESIIGAIYLDQGYRVARRWIRRLFYDEVMQVAREINQENYKATLQTFVHREMSGESLNYLVLDEKGPPHHKCFKIAVQIGKRLFQAAWGQNKKETEQRAAENAYSILTGKKPPHSDGD